MSTRSQLLTSAEHALLATFRGRMSDRARNALLGISLDEAHRLLFSMAVAS